MESFTAQLKALLLKIERETCHLSVNASLLDLTPRSVPGLVAEADTAEALLAKLRVLIPELLDANGYPDAGEVPFELFSRRFDVAYRQAA